MARFGPGIDATPITSPTCRAEALRFTPQTRVVLYPLIDISIKKLGSGISNVKILPVRIFEINDIDAYFKSG